MTDNLWLQNCFTIILKMSRGVKQKLVPILLFISLDQGSILYACLNKVVDFNSVVNLKVK